MTDRWDAWRQRELVADAMTKRGKGTGTTRPATPAKPFVVTFGTNGVWAYADTEAEARSLAQDCKEQRAWATNERIQVRRLDTTSTRRRYI